MVKTAKLMVCGSKAIGKSYMLNSLAYSGTSPQNFIPTIEDTYLVQLDSELGLECRLFDTEGLGQISSEESLAEVPSTVRSMAAIMDAIVLMYRVCDIESLRTLQNFCALIDNVLHKRNARKEMSVGYMLVGIEWDGDRICEETREIAKTWKRNDKNILLWKEIGSNDHAVFKESLAIFVKEICMSQGRTGFTLGTRKR